VNILKQTNDGVPLEVQGQHVRLRLLETGDAADLLDAFTESAAEYDTGFTCRAKSLPETVAKIQLWENQFYSAESLHYGIFSADGSMVIGWVGLRCESLRLDLFIRTSNAGAGLGRDALQIFLEVIRHIRLTDYFTVVVMQNNTRVQRWLVKQGLTTASNRGPVRIAIEDVLA